MSYWYRLLTLLLLCGANVAFGCNAGCLTCNGLKCSECDTNYYLNGDICAKCRSRCTSCNSFYNCTSCVSGNYGPYCQYSCSTCQDGLCSKNGCTQGCKLGYFNNGVGYCAPCPSNCLACTDKRHCYQCIPGKWGPVCLDSCDSYHCKDNICSHDKSECNDGCADGYYANGNSCYGCPFYCSTCISTSVCESCKDGTWGMKCQSKCLNNCTTCTKSTGECGGSDCLDGYYMSNTDNTCIKCPVGCSSCSSSSVCTACSIGFALSGSSTCVIQCPVECSTCSSLDVCTACITGYLLSGGSSCVLQCPVGCSTCSSPDVCTSCSTGYVLSGGTSCVIKCLVGCSSCLSADVCTSCSTGYVLSGGSSCVIKCPIGCSTCSSPDVCTSCSTGYVLSGASSCVIKCPVGCSTCSSPDVCTSCSTGYVLSGDSSCVIKCPVGCSTCSLSYVCIECTTGYVLSEGKCTPCPIKCSTCSSPRVCTVCTAGYVLSGDICSQCQVGCSTCTSPSVCTTCTTDYELTGKTCNRAAGQTADTDTNVAVIGGAAGGIVIVIIIAVVIGICIIKKRRNHKTSKVPDEEIQPVNNPLNDCTVMNTNDSGYASVNTTKQNEDIPMTNIPKPSSQQEAPPVPSNEPLQSAVIDIEDVEIDDDSECVVLINEQPPDDNVYYTNVAGLKRSRIQVDQLQDYVEQKTKDEFLNEFKKLPQGLARPFNDAMKPINRPKNRYKRIYPYDISRVKLLDGGPDFINANYIDGYNTPTAYIASLGPTHNTMDDYKDFWRMVWQEKVGKIVMLTNLMENGTMKCEQYWPNPGVSQSYGNVVVTCHSEDKYSEHTIKGLTVTKDEEQRSLIHLHYTAWPDKGVPDDVTSLIEFRQRVLSTRAETDGPVIVHCSAGVGRTGTYIALDILTKEGIAEKSVDIFGCVLGMRSQRVSMVQTEEQYEYIHRSVVHALWFDCQAIQGNQFLQCMKDNTEKLHAQFKHIESTVERKSEEEIEAVKRNRTIHEKNRKHADVSGDRYRPRLYLRRKPGASDYINAVLVNSYKTKNRYIVAQTPLPGTVVDFLSLVVQERCPCIVSMDETNIHDKTVGAYLPTSNQILKHGIFNISCVSCETTSQYILRKLKVEYHGLNDPEGKTISHFQIPSWTKSKLVPDPLTFLKLVQDAEKAANESTDNGPIVVHCLTGGERSGLFCAVSVLIQKMEVDHEVSVVNTVRQIKTRRHSAIPNQEQYVFCHQCVSAYLQSFDIYSNFSHI